MIHPLYLEAKKMSEEEVQKKEIDVMKDAILEPVLKEELNKILDDNYARGAFIGMCTNIYFQNVNTGKVIGIDSIIKQALQIRLKAYSMAERSLPKPKKDEDIKLELN